MSGPTDSELYHAVISVYRSHEFGHGDYRSAMAQLRSLFAPPHAMTGRLEVASRIMAGFAARDGTAEDARPMARTALAWADALIAADQDRDGLQVTHWRELPEGPKA